MLNIAREAPDSPDLALLMARHTAQMRAETPHESIHMMSPAQLAADAQSVLFVMRAEGMPVAMGALRRIGPDAGELKSMHVLAERRREGLARRMLDHLIAEARAAGMIRLSLETGATPGFAAALALYRRAGFCDCDPFGAYRPDVNSVFLTLDLRKPC